MSYQYYQQFTDDEDLFPVHQDEDDDYDHDEDEHDMEEEEGCSCSRGCKYCLGTEW